MLEELETVDLPACPSACGLAVFQQGGHTQLLIAAGHRRLMHCERDFDAANATPPRLAWTVTRLELPLVPSTTGDAPVPAGDVVCIVAHSRPSNSPIIACLLVASPASTASSTTPPHLCVFGARLRSSGAAISAILADCQALPLTYSPVTLVRVDSRRASGFLVTASDGSLHFYVCTDLGSSSTSSTSPSPTLPLRSRSTALRPSSPAALSSSLPPAQSPLAAAMAAAEASASETVSEVALDQTLPELAIAIAASAHSPVISITIAISGPRRLTACGCANGFLFIASVDEFNGSMTHDQTFLDGPITSVCWVCAEKPLPALPTLHHGATAVMVRAEAQAAKSGAVEPLFISAKQLVANDDSSIASVRPHDLVVGGGLGYVARFNTAHLGHLASPPFLLPMSSNADAVTGVAAADVDVDGWPEIVVVTHSGLLFAFGRDGSVRLQQRFPSPLLAARSCSGIACDPPDAELAVLAWNGCHILRPDIRPLLTRCLAELHALSEIRTLELELSNRS